MHLLYVLKVLVVVLFIVGGDGTGAASCLGVGDVEGILQITGRVLLFVVSIAKEKERRRNSLLWTYLRNEKSIEILFSSKY